MEEAEGLNLWYRDGVKIRPLLAQALLCATIIGVSLLHGRGDEGSWITSAVSNATWYCRYNDPCDYHPASVCMRLPATPGKPTDGGWWDGPFPTRADCMTVCAQWSGMPNQDCPLARDSMDAAAFPLKGNSSSISD